ncbi:MAG: tyrosine-protein phosphatase [Sedimentibacter sp.]
MIDMHTHILFGVDDGAKTPDDSLALIKDEINKGVNQIILTPHYNKRHSDLNIEKITENFNILKESILQENLEIELFLGSEVYLDFNYYDTIWKEPIITLADSDYVLIEFSMTDIPKNIPEICYEIRLKGLIPIIAHVERYDILYDNSQLIKDILNEGAHFQVNATTVINKEGRGSYKFANYLLKNELVSFVASDVHNIESRAFYLDKAYSIVNKICSHNYAEKIFNENQENIIMNKYFDSPKFDIKKGVISKLFNKS